MGTRADFYVGKGASAEWLGSIAFDGYRDGIGAQILQCTSPEAFRHAVKAMFAERDDATLPDDGWPWPWESSATTDCSYWHFSGKTWDDFSGHYAPCDEPDPTSDDIGDDDSALCLGGLELIEYPDMSARKRVTLGPRSGLIVIGLDNQG